MARDCEVRIRDLLKTHFPLTMMVVSPKRRSAVVLVGEPTLQNGWNFGSAYSQSASRVTGIFEIWTEFGNLHVSFEHRRRDFRVPVEISLVYWRYKAMDVYLHYGIKYFKNNNRIPSILNLFLVNAFFRIDFQKCLTCHSHVVHYKEKFECSFNSWKYWSRVTWIDCNSFHPSIM